MGGVNEELHVKKRLQWDRTRLFGKARHSTKVWLHSNTDFTNVNVVYSLQRCHFGDIVHSDLPLAAFYTGQTFAGENPSDYWI